MADITARRHPHRLAHLLAPALLVLVTACGGTGGTGGGGHASGKPRATGVGDPLFPKLGDAGYHVRHYGLTLDYEPEGNHLRGTAAISARAAQDLGSVTFDFKGLKVRSATVDGQPARTSRAGDKLTVTPRSSVGKGSDFETVVVYDGVPKDVTDADGESTEGWVETDDGAVALGEPTGSMTWFPGNHHPSDKATYDVTVTVPADYTAVANGELKRKDVHGGRATFAWHNPEPMASYLASVAISPFKVTETRADGLPVYLAVHPEETEAGARLEKLLPEVLAWESGMFGPYPFSSAGAVLDHNAYIDYALETQTKPYFDSAPSDKLVVHELAHQWFGDSVTPRTWKDMWLNESFAQYAEWMWEEAHGGRGVQQIFDDHYDGKDPESKGIWDFPPGDPTPVTISDSPVYGRGAMVLHKVRQTVGDATFFDIVRTWTSEHRYGNVDTAEFVALCEKKSGKDLGELFRTWLYTQGRPAAP
ncbi:M1 family metallopeptidase [Streptomyces gamaensis]|uniref:Aminopeptidase N n=1 Tax=Streptomyces gamaensis TaxID=1763542 RepID=A0ABW0YYT0_9ACTN